MDYRNFSDKDLKWIKRFDKVMKDAPSDLFMFVGNGQVVVYSERRMDNGGVNDDVPSMTITTKMECDGGDW